jgi:hypothetical protein
VQHFQPKSLLVTHGARWRFGTSPRQRIKVVARELGVRLDFVDLEQARCILGCARQLRAVAERIVDSYPERAPLVRPFLSASTGAANARARRPTLSAMTVAHAASVAHLIKFG